MICLLGIILSLFLLLVVLFIEYSKFILLYITILLHTLVLVSYLITAFINPGLAARSDRIVAQGSIPKSRL